MRIGLPFSISLGLLGIIIMLSLGLWTSLPPGTELPYHFGFGGADGPKASAGVTLSIMPVVAALATLLFSIAPYVDHRLHRFEGRYTAIWLATLLILSIAQGIIIRHALMSLPPQ